MSKILIESYNRLLADIVRLSGCAIGTPDNIVLEWLLVKGPSLDKQILALIESNNVISDDDVTLLIEEAPHMRELLREFFLEHNRLICDREKRVNPLRAGCLLKYVRQCLLFCYKAEYEPTPLQISAAEQTFIEGERGIEVFDDYLKTSSSDPLFREASKLISRVIYKINWSEIMPSHGPGAVFPSRVPCDKSSFRSIYDSIECYYPYAEYFCGIPSFWEEAIVNSQDNITTCSQIVAKLVCVPKDSRGPRLICVHPAEAVWVQQGHRLLIEHAIKHSPLTRSCISFDDQSKNGSLAYQSSIDREFCTLDLSEASDSISRELVRTLFGSAFKYLDCCRATHVQLLDGSTVPLRKMFPMGNASTFPVESLIFWACVRAGIRCYYGVNCSNIYVFGDDIIVPSRYYDGVIASLVRFGLKPNQGKCFYRGFFRESCGVDAYKGINVTPYRIRVRNDVTVSSLASLCDLAKRLRIAGFEDLSSFLYTRVRQRIKKVFGPRFCLWLNNNPDAQGVYEFVQFDFCKLLKYGYLRFSKNTHTWLAPSILPKAVVTHGKDSWWNLQDSLLSITRKGDAYSDHELEYKVPNLIRPTTGWTPISMR